MMKKTLLTLTILFVSISLIAQWDGNPATVYNPMTNNLYPYYGNTGMAVSDDDGSIINTWIKGSINNFSILAQKKLSNGQIAWNSIMQPVQIFDGGDASILDMVADGLGGVYIAYKTDLTDTTSILRLQRINQNGVPIYANGGIEIKNSNGKYFEYCLLHQELTNITITWAEEKIRRQQGSVITLSSELFVQRYNNLGQPIWGTNPIKVSNSSSIIVYPEMIGDGNNGVFIAFLDTRNTTINDGEYENSDIYCQHFNNNGNKVWAENGMPISTSLYNQYPSTIEPTANSMVADGLGGFYIIYISYLDSFDGSDELIIQRINAAGSKTFPDDLILPSTYFTNSWVSLINILSDGNNGAVAILEESSIINLSERKRVVAQRINTNGNFLWGSNFAITGASRKKIVESSSIKDASGNYVCAWVESDEITDARVIKAQKFNNDSLKIWDINGVLVCTNPLSLGNAYFTTSSNGLDIVKSTNNNTICIWDDKREQYKIIPNTAKISGLGNLITTNSPGYVTAANGSWNAGSTWVGGQVPPSGADVTVLHNILVNTNVTCNSLTIVQPGNITVGAGVVVTVIR